VKKGVSVMGLLMELLVGASTRGCSGVGVRSRVARLRPSRVGKISGLNARVGKI